MSYPRSPGFKEGTTSHESAVRIEDYAGSLRQQVYLLYARAFRLTADEAAEHLGVSILSIRPRISELTKMGLLCDTGERRYNASGHRAKVMMIAPSKSQLEFNL